VEETTMAELTRKYVVMAMATEGSFDLDDPNAPFVLKPWKDPAALVALAAYRDNCYPELRRELDAWITVIGAGPVVRGDVGRRNEPHVRARVAGAKSAKAKRPAKPTKPARAARRRKTQRRA
jgi:hypothetical protein